MEDIDPKDFAKQFAESAAPLIAEAVKNAMEDWARENAAQRPSTPATEPWRGGPLSNSQVDSLISRDAAATLSRMASDLSDIKAAIQSQADGGQS